MKWVSKEKGILKLSLAVLMVFSLLSVFALAETIEVWLTGHSNEEMRIIRDLTDELFTPRTGIEVEYTLLSWADNENRFLLAAASGDAPDVGASGALFLPELGLRGALIDLRTFPDFEEVYSRSYPNFYRSLTYQGVVFGIPYTANVTTAFQRTDILQSIGVDEVRTWDELKTILPKLQANNSNFALQWFMTETLYADVNMFMWQRGADDYSKDLTKSGYDDPEAIHAFTDYVELYTKYNIPKDIPVFQAFTTGELAIALSYPYFYMSLLHGAPQIQGKWTMVQAPGYVIDGQLNRTTTGGGNSLGIFNSSKKKQQAWEFIKWITSEEVQLAISNRVMAQIQGAMFLPSNRGAALKLDVDPVVASSWDKALHEATSSVYGLVAPRHRRRYLQMAAQKSILMGVDPETAMREAADEHNSEIARKQKEYDRYIKQLLGK
ncbi:MAG: ABC transporter substrate-binding protein [Bacillota bacterium]|jgi:ABC-type glycerol-3-phosphate transport system substrate-binding protein|nr:extracellular solute-binding protein [Bacillota bacterium]HOA90676.1 extracellular solute-binding protein [Bacillota bacterium]HOL13040.1 extracellular solute-binding protein [Bacillota bacterium]HOP52994.1 extracellular solute-binding protein [Bacillota bacterium]HPT61061.1 extracellular solute-binding protein [Bacillota bacterium]